MRLLRKVIPLVVRGFPAALLIIVAAGTSCASHEPPLQGSGRRVLFVGNSLTYYNNLPATVAAIAQSVGDPMTVHMEAGANLALIDHLNGATNAADQIAHGNWDVVVLQQGPTPPGICRDSLILWTRMFDTQIRASGARTAMFMSWPLAGPLRWFDDIEESFVQASGAVHATMFPIAEAWRIALTNNGALELYQPDGLHPTPTGTLLAAFEIYERLTGRDARTLPPQALVDGQPLDIPFETIMLLQQAAHEASERTPLVTPSVPITRTSQADGPTGC